MCIRDRSKAIQEMTHEDYFHFYDAAAPIIEKESIDFSKAYVKSRYDKGEAAYINCPMNKEEFDAFYDALLHAETAELHDLSLIHICKKYHPTARYPRSDGKTDACRT